MSIWATFVHFSDDGDEDEGPPIVYYGSHLFPTDIRDGSVDVALIPGFISPDRSDDDYDDDPAGPPHPFVRLCVNEGGVILDRSQVLLLFHRLGEWLMATASNEVEAAAVTPLEDVR